MGGLTSLHDITGADIRVRLCGERGGNVPPCVVMIKLPFEHTLQDNVLLFVDPTPPAYNIFSCAYGGRFIRLGL